jgi:hypothetical protein
MEIDDYILISNTIPKYICKQLVDECEENRFPGWDTSGGRYPYAGGKINLTGADAEEFTDKVKRKIRKRERFKTATSTKYATDDQQDILKPSIVKALDEYQKLCVRNEEYWPWPDGSKTAYWLKEISTVRFNKYPAGTGMSRHYDHIQNAFGGEGKGVPLVSIVGQLNNSEDYEGCKFICRGKIISLGAGDILMFPSNFMYPHSVSECTKGTRYSFVCWAY